MNTQRLTTTLASSSEPTLKEQAELACQCACPDVTGMTQESMQRLIYDLKVHQIELGMQNEELRCIQLELAESRDRYLELFDFAPISYLTLDPDLVIQEANLAAANLLGTERARLFGGKFTHWVAAQSQDRLYHHHFALTESGDRQSCELVLRRPDGSTFPAELQSLPGSAVSGQATLFRCVVSDISERKRAEAAITQHCEDLFGQTLQALPAHLAVIDSTGCILAVNQQWMDFARRNGGASLPTVKIGANYLEACRHATAADDTDGADARKALAGIEDVLNQERPSFSMEYRCDSPTEIRWFNMMAVPLESHAGAVISHLNITERKLAEQKLADSEAFYRQMLESLPGLVFINRPDGHCNYQSQQWVEYTGVPLMEQLDDGWKKLLHPDDRQRVDAQCLSALERGCPFDLEYRLRRHDGVYQWFRVVGHPIRDDRGEIERWLGIALNIDELERTKEELRLSEERFRQVFEHAASGIAITDWDGRFLQCNPAYCTLLGYTAEELSCRDFPKLIHPEDRAANLEKLRQLKNQEIPFFEIENRYVRKDGEPVWAHKVVSLLRDETGAPIRIVALVADITERRRMERVLRDADRRKDEFLATLAHELRTPLGALSNALAVLQRVRDDPAITERFQDMMERQVTHLVRLVDDLMEVSRISRGKIELVKAPVTLQAVIQQSVESVRAQIDAAGHRLTLSLPTQPMLLDADEIRLAQVFSNLLTNATKYLDPDGAIELSARREGDSILVSVRDMGIGIAADDLPRVFELFTQVGRQSGRYQSGLGIGLALVERLVEMHDGQISVRSDGLGQGSEFVVSLPLADAGLLKSDPVPDGTAILAGQRIHLADDDPDMANSLGVLLELSGAAQIQVVYDGAAALSAIETFHPTIVILDLGMPGMDGYEVARRIRQHARYRNLKLIALTGWGQEADRRQSAAAGFDHHLVKPVDFDRLMDLLVSL